jgi:hypothetical protein
MWFQLPVCGVSANTILANVITRHVS